MNVVMPFPASGQAVVSVVDLLGRLVVTERYFGNAGGTEIVGLDLTSITNGVYIIVVNLDGQITTGKLIKE
jgi:hypothetical protein